MEAIGALAVQPVGTEDSSEERACRQGYHYAALVAGRCSPPPPYSYYTILSFHLAAQPELYDYYFHTFNFHIRGCRPPAAIDSSCRS